ncbi:helix-turn-helix domain-containing protein [Paraburkholderia sediminicola]|uniref:hypothetical protein n=1 Tax=Paraburkholderia sediminicola TaxID=458836 RepID=UPI0038B775D3
MKKPAVRPPKPPRGPKLIRPTLAEEIEIARGIAADPDARPLSRNEIRRLRPYSYWVAQCTRMAEKRAKQAMTETRKRIASRPYDAADYLKDEETIRLYFAAAQADGDPRLIAIAESAIQRARARIEARRRAIDAGEYPL